MDVGQMQRKLSLWAEQDKEHRFFDLYDLVRNMDWLHAAHDRIVTNAGSKTAGCDGLVMKDFDENLEANLQALRQDLTDGTFVAHPVRRVYIPKSNGKWRPLGIPSVRNRIVQEALRMVLEPIYEADFSQCSYGFRPGRCTMDAIKRILWYTHDAKKMHWIIEGDISAYFDTILHRKLMQLLRQRVQDAKLLTLIWKFLRAGVMERKLFKDTLHGTPQGGIISPLLANVYLHELDRYMEKYTALSQKDKAVRRRQREANCAYVRYADDWVILCNGSKEQAYALRDEIKDFLSTALGLTLSEEKTKVTHLNDGFDFLGFHIKRMMGQEKMLVKVFISEKGLQRHRDTLKAATSRSTQDSFVLRITALNRIISGWCRYYQYVSNASTIFHKIGHDAFWLFAHWVAQKHQLSIPETLKRYQVNGRFGFGNVLLRLHNEFHTRRYNGRFIKPNPYTAQDALILERETLPEERLWLGNEERPGTADLKREVIRRDNFRCQHCGQPVTIATSEMDHRKPVRRFGKLEDAQRLENLQTLCIPCHERKTEEDRQRESRVH